MNSETELFTEEMKTFAVEAIQLFSKLIQNEDGELFPEILVETTKGKQSIIVVQAGSGEEPVSNHDLVAEGRELLVKLQEQKDVIKIAALVFDAFLTVKDEKFSAIIVEILDADAKHVFAQRYRVSEGQNLELIGNLAYLAGKLNEKGA